jgi:hypothetical protein
MTETIQRRVRLAPDLWVALDAIAAARGVAVGVVFEEAARAYVDPLAAIDKAARIISDLASDRAALAEKIDLMFLTTTGNASEDA